VVSGRRCVDRRIGLAPGRAAESTDRCTVGRGHRTGRDVARRHELAVGSCAPIGDHCEERTSASPGTGTGTRVLPRRHPATSPPLAFRSFGARGLR
jgi:hypothetical protein